jgi:hypothetical protein
MSDPKTHIVLVTSYSGAFLKSLKDAFGSMARIEHVKTLDELLGVSLETCSIVVCYATGVIVPPSVLNQLHRPGYNFHPGSPQYPGRDPHHLAIYEGARRYGATAHILTRYVDSGPIVGVESFDVQDGCRPLQLLEEANRALFRLFCTLAPSIATGNPLRPLSEIAWGRRKSSARGFREACRLPTVISREQLERRFRAFDDGTYSFTTELHGHTFRLDPKALPRGPDERFAEFTESGYRKLLRAAAGAGYVFVPYGLTDAPEQKRIILHHNVIYSVHRAAALGVIEQQEGVRSTFFFDLHSRYYNLLEPQLAKLVARIRATGHEIGLLTDQTDALPGRGTGRIIGQIQIERQLISAVTDATPMWVSAGPRAYAIESIESDPAQPDLLGPAAAEDWIRVSDDRGSWAPKPIGGLLGEGHDRLVLLIDPVWWTPEPLSPSEKIERCIAGRAQSGFQLSGAEELGFGTIAKTP